MRPHKPERAPCISFCRRCRGDVAVHGLLLEFSGRGVRPIALRTCSRARMRIARLWRVWPSGSRSPGRRASAARGEVFGRDARERYRQHLLGLDFLLKQSGHPPLHRVGFAGSRPCDHPNPVVERLRFTRRCFYRDPYPTPKEASGSHGSRRACRLNVSHDITSWAKVPRNSNLLACVLPLQVSGASASGFIGQVNVVPVPVECYFAPEDVVRLLQPAVEGEAFHSQSAEEAEVIPLRQQKRTARASRALVGCTAYRAIIKQ